MGEPPSTTLVPGPPRVPGGGAPGTAAAPGARKVTRGTGAGFCFVHHSRYSAPSHARLLGPRSSPSARQPSDEAEAALVGRPGVKDGARVAGARDAGTWQGSGTVRGGCATATPALTRSKPRRPNSPLSMGPVPSVAGLAARRGGEGECGTRGGWGTPAGARRPSCAEGR